jgi:hypothetical protein
VAKIGTATDPLVAFAIFSAKAVPAIIDPLGHARRTATALWGRPGNTVFGMESSISVENYRIALKRGRTGLGRSQIAVLRRISRLPISTESTCGKLPVPAGITQIYEGVMKAARLWKTALSAAIYPAPVSACPNASLRSVALIALLPSFSPIAVEICDFGRR